MLLWLPPFIGESAFFLYVKGFSRSTKQLHILVEREMIKIHNNEFFNYCFYALYLNYIIQGLVIQKKIARNIICLYTSPF